MKFIELRFGQGMLGKEFIDRKKNHETFVQRELVPVKAIKDAFIVLPEKRNIQITFEHGGRLFTRTEYYKNTIDCIKRWVMIKKACGITAKFQMMCPVPLPMDAEEMAEIEKEEQAKKADKKEE